MCLQKKYWWCADKRHTQKSTKKIFSLKFQLIFYNLHGIKCAWCTCHNVAILLPDVVYDVNNKLWQYWYVANKIRNFLFMMKIFKKMLKNMLFYNRNWKIDFFEYNVCLMFYNKILFTNLSKSVLLSYLYNIRSLT